MPEPEGLVFVVEGGADVRVSGREVEIFREMAPACVRFFAFMGVTVIEVRDGGAELLSATECAQLRERQGRGDAEAGP